MKLSKIMMMKDDIEREKKLVEELIQKEKQ
jgi:hypothetical protein